MKFWGRKTKKKDFPFERDDPPTKPIQPTGELLRTKEAWDLLGTSTHLRETRRLFYQHCQVGNIQEALKYLKSRSLTSPIDSWGNTALHLTVSQNDYGMTCGLLLKGADPNVSNRSGTRPLDIARKLCFQKICNVLVVHGAVAGVKDEGGNSNEESTVDEQDRLNAVNDAEADSGNEESNDHLNWATPSDLSTGSDANLSSIWHYPSPQPHDSSSGRSGSPGRPNLPFNSALTFPDVAVSLVDAAYLGMRSEIFRSAPLNSVRWADPTTGWTPLMKASYNGHVHLVSTLLKRYPDGIDARDREGITALVWACIRGHEEVTECLLNARKSKFGEREGKSISSASSVTPLIAACFAGHGRIVRMLLRDGHDVNETVNRKSPLMVAAWSGHEDLVRLLLESGAVVPENPRTLLRKGAKFVALQNEKLLLDENVDLSALAGSSDDLSELTPSAKQNVDRMVGSAPADEGEPEYHLKIRVIEHLLIAGAKSGSSPTLSEKVSNRPGERKTEWRQLLAHQNLKGYDREIEELTEYAPGQGTDLDHMVLNLAHCLIHLIKAVSDEGKHLYIAIAAKAAHIVAELVRSIDLNVSLPPVAVATSLSPPNSKPSASSELKSPVVAVPPRESSDSSFMTTSPLHKRVVETAVDIRDVHTRAFVSKTRVAVGIWPPPDAVPNMIREAVALANRVRTLVELANAMGFWPWKDISFDLNTFQLDFPADPATTSINQENKRVLNFTDYKRNDDLKKIEEKAKALSATTRTDEGVEEETDPDAEFFSRLYELAKQFVGAVKHLRSVQTRSAKEEYVSATGEVCSKADAIAEEVRGYELFADLPPVLAQGGSGESEETSLRKRIAMSVDEVLKTAQDVARKGIIASGVWPPPDSAAEMINATVPCASSIRNLVAVSKSATARVRQVEGAERQRKEEWKKKCLQNERVKELFNMFEMSQMAQSAAEDETAAMTGGASLELSKEERDMLEDSKDGLVVEEVNGVERIKGGRLAKLVERLTSHSMQESSYRDAFLLTYNAFTTPTELADLILKRYDIRPPFGLNQRTFDIYLKFKILPVRLRVFNVLKAWIEKFFEDFLDNKALMIKLRTFIEKKLAVDFPEMAARLLTLFDQKLDGTRHRVFTADKSIEFPRLVLTRPVEDLPAFLLSSRGAILEIDPVEVARQLTLLEWGTYVNIGAKECLTHIWAGKVNADRTVSMGPRGIPATIQHTNRLTNWISTVIVDNETIKGRLTALKYFASLAVALHEINNFNALTAVVASLTSGPVHRLDETWEGFEEKQSKLFQQYHKLAEIVSPTGQYANYRRALHSANPPVIPFLGVYLTDLTFVDIGNVDFMAKSHFIHFDKWRQASVIIQELQQYQQKGYHFARVKPLAEYLESCQGWNEKQLYDRSIQVEPPPKEEGEI